jgi:lysophospholipid acyltransferase (LPLAT)-like uncharacterized protein
LSDVHVRQPNAAERAADDAASRARERRMRWLVRLGVPIVRLLGRTWRIRILNRTAVVDHLRKTHQPLIFALWHGDMLPLLYVHRGEGVAVLISEHRDGELIARVAESLGFRTVRGSTSRGASRALVGLVRELSAGHDVAITPDGPRGPARSFAPGALIAAQRAEAPVVAVGLSASRAWRLRTWDGFVIPKPFSRVTVAYSDAAWLRGMNAREAADDTSRFEVLMADARRRADA